MNGVSAITYRLFILIFFASFQLFCPDGSVFAAVKSESYSLDVNGDGVKEDIFVDEKSGDVYVVDSAGKTLVRGSNLAVDGYSVFDGIKKAPDGNYGFVIVNRGGNFGARIYNLISFIDKGFYLSKVSADVRNNIDGVIYSDVHCEIKPDLPFNRISADNVAQVLLPVEDKRFLQQCSENIGSYFKFSELESLTKSGSITWTVKSIGYFINANGINKDNVTAYNNIAYYIFSSNPNDFVTYYILEKIIFSFPDRAVAYLNIADYLAANSKCDEAGLSYSKYISLMKSGGKEKKIPKRVLNYQTTNVCR